MPETNRSRSRSGVREPRGGAQALNERWRVGVVEARFNWDGHWYKKLTRFPAAYFDPNGYLRFESQADFLNCPGLRIGKQVGLRKPGISALTGYVRMIDAARGEASGVSRPKEAGAGVLKRRRDDRAVWKLTLHHDDPDLALKWVRATGRIAVGWGRVGDLAIRRPSSDRAIGEMVRSAYPRLRNSHIGGPSLWRFVAEMQLGDLVILAGRGKRHGVVEISGAYNWAEPEDSLSDYQHQRDVEWLDTDADELWKAIGGVAKHEAVRWVVARCRRASTKRRPSPNLDDLMEGARVEVRASKAERKMAARRACIAHYGHACVVCHVRLRDRYGMARDFVHVHHLSPFEGTTTSRRVDPIKDLRPVCPNCHAMLHTQSPPLTIDELRGRLRKR